jgi:hypothetical protein
MPETNYCNWCNIPVLLRDRYGTCGAPVCVDNAERLAQDVRQLSVTMNRRHVSMEELRARGAAGQSQPQAVEALILWEWQCPVCENWRTGETCHTCGTHEKESRHHREKR